MEQIPSEVGSNAQETSNENPDYSSYLLLHGIINEKDYKSAFSRAESSATPSKADIQEVKNIAGFAGIELHNEGDSIDKRIVLYSVLRNDAKPKDVIYHHSKMGDIKLFAEVLRMTEDVFALNQMMDKWHRKGRVGDLCPICEKTITAGQDCG